jgi:hypothetical protein
MHPVSPYETTAFKEMHVLQDVSLSGTAGLDVGECIMYNHMK